MTNKLIKRIDKFIEKESKDNNHSKKLYLITYDLSDEKSAYNLKTNINNLGKDKILLSNTAYLVYSDDTQIHTLYKNIKIECAEKNKFNIIDLVYLKEINNVCNNKEIKDFLSKH